MRMKLMILLPFLLQLSRVSCSSVSFVDLEKVKTELDLKAFPEQQDYPEADAVVLWEEHDVNAIIDDEYDLVTDEKITRVTKLFKNVDDHASVEISVYSGEDLVDIQARTIKADGSVIELQKEDFHVSTGVGEGHVYYSDERRVKFTFPAAEKNCILEVSYKIHETHPFIQGEWDIQRSIPVLCNTFKLTAPLLLMQSHFQGGVGWTWRYKPYNCTLTEPMFDKNRTPSKLLKDQTVTFTWTKRNIPAFEPDPMMGPHLDHLMYVKFAPSEWKTWDDISGWYCKYYLRPQLVTTNDISDKAARLTQGCTTETEKIRRLFTFVQTLRYVAVAIGEGGFEPSRPQQVLERMYGDCKDKSVLLLSLLASAGVEAKPALLLTSGVGKIDPGFPSWNFNHMIVRACTKDGIAYWLDPTADHCSLGEIPYQDRGTIALVLNDDNTSTLHEIPQGAVNDNARDIRVKVEVGEAEETTFDASMSFKGQENLKMRSFLADMTKEDIAKYCRSLLSDQSLETKLVDYSLENADRPDSCLVFNFRMTWPSPLERQGDLTFLNIDPFESYGDWSWLARDKRKYDIRFKYPGTYTKTIEVILPEGKYRVRNLPANAAKEQNGLRFEKKYSIGENGHLLVDEVFSITRPVIEAKNFQDMKNFIGFMKSGSAQKIVLTTD